MRCRKKRDVGPQLFRQHQQLFFSQLPAGNPIESAQHRSRITAASAQSCCNRYVFFQTDGHQTITETATCCQKRFGCSHGEIGIISRDRCIAARKHHFALAFSRSNSQLYLIVQVDFLHPGA
nr:hypothetical protein [Desulforhopalus singaporensis]